MKRRHGQSGTISRDEEQRRKKTDLDDRMATGVRPTLKSFSYEIYQVYILYDKYQRERIYLGWRSEETLLRGADPFHLRTLTADSSARSELANR